VLINLRLRGREDADMLAEFRELARSAGVETVAELGGSRPSPDPAYFIGRGKVEELRAMIIEHRAEVALFNHALSPAQERNLEKALECRVVDRTGVILDIFAQRAHTFEGKLQVELAQLEHLSTRLVRGWTHLERQRGGSIGLRGPGETQLEIDRRLIGRRIRQIHERLQRVRSQRRERRRGRDRAEIPTISLVGYTNAGKSTLFNQLTGADAYVANQLFATLDPTLRRLALPGAGYVVLSDTVGFLRDLPHELVAAFRATLEEVLQADLLLKVVDAADEERDTRCSDVGRVLVDIQADGLPVLEVYNQIDRLPGVVPHVDSDGDGVPQRVWISAQTGAGMDQLIESITKRLNIHRPYQVLLPPEAGRLRARLHDEGVILAEVRDPAGGWQITLGIDAPRLRRLCLRSGLDPDKVSPAVAHAAA
jgi:GTP-binding protein HflX